MRVGGTNTLMSIWQTLKLGKQPQALPLWWFKKVVSSKEEVLMQHLTNDKSDVG